MPAEGNRLAGPSDGNRRRAAQPDLRRREYEAVNVAGALTLIFCFPVAGPLLFALTLIEERLPDQPPGARSPD